MKFVLTVVVCSLCSTNQEPRTQFSVAFETMEGCRVIEREWASDEDVRIIERCTEQ
jgi:hypothetical protein